MRRILLLLAFVLPVVAALHAPDAAAQEVGARYRVILTDGTVLTGTLTSATAAEIVLESDSGLRTTIPRAQIRELDPFMGGFLRGDPNPTRLLFFPTARSLSAGTGRFGTYFIFPTVAYGLTDNVDVSVGATIPIEGAGVLNLNGKVTPVQTETFSFAVGASALVVYGDSEGSVGGTFYGVATIGTPEQAFTIGGLGVYAKVEDEDLDVADGGALVLGFEKQLSNNVKFLTENYIGFGGGEMGALLSAGVRFFGERLSADIAPVVAIGGGEVQFIPIPYFTFSYSFGR